MQIKMPPKIVRTTPIPVLFDPLKRRPLVLPSKISSFWLYSPYIFDSLETKASDVVICVFKL